MSEDEIPTVQTVMFADIVDSTGLYEDFGDEQAQATLQACMDVMEEVVQACDGAVRKRIGDELLCVFAQSRNAVDAATQLHDRVVKESERGAFPRPMRLRIGFEEGEVIERDGELFGGSVHTAARLAALAKAGQILTTRETLSRVETETRLPQRLHDKVQLKGQREEREIIELLWSHASTVLSSQAGRRRTDGGIAAVVLASGSQRFQVDSTTVSATIGRDEICDLRVSGDAVSRLHMKIKLERGRVHIEDISSNGSGIRPEQGRARDLHRDGSSLEGRGVLRLGLHCDDAEAAFVTYACLEQGDGAFDPA